MSFLVTSAMRTPFFRSITIVVMIITVVFSMYDDKGDDYTYTALVLFVISTILLAVSIVSAFSAIRGRNNEIEGIINVILASILSVMTASAAYYDFGFYENGTLSNDREDAIFLSIVTWSTLGYGNLIPAGYAKIIASVQVILGQVSMAMITALIISVALPHKTKDED